MKSKSKYIHIFFLGIKKNSLISGMVYLLGLELLNKQVGSS